MNSSFTEGSNICSDCQWHLDCYWWPLKGQPFVTDITNTLPSDTDLQSVFHLSHHQDLFQFEQSDCSLVSNLFDKYSYWLNIHGKVFTTLTTLVVISHYKKGFYKQLFPQWERKVLAKCLTTALCPILLPPMAEYSHKGFNKYSSPSHGGAFWQRVL